MKRRKELILHSLPVHRVKNTWIHSFFNFSMCKEKAEVEWNEKNNGFKPESLYCSLKSPLKMSLFLPPSLKGKKIMRLDTAYQETHIFAHVFLNARSFLKPRVTYVLVKSVWMPGEICKTLIRLTTIACLSSEWKRNIYRRATRD